MLSGNGVHYTMSSLCSPMQAIAAIDIEQRDELEAIIQELEEENRFV